MAKMSDETSALIKRIRRLLGEPVRSVELTDEQICELMQVGVEDIMEVTLNEMITNNWMGLYGKNSTNAKELSYAFTTRSLDMTKDYSYWFSKQVGLQQNGPWELKKDFIEIEMGKQVYVVPSGRTINKVLLWNPPMTDLGIMGGMGIGMGFMPGMGNAVAPYGSAYGGGIGGFYTVQAADAAFMTADLNFKSRLFRGDLTYKVTAGPEGTHLIHIISTPGSRLSFGFSGIGDDGTIGLVGSHVWYTYYDTTSDDDAMDCMLAHPDDVILTPDQVPVSRMSYEFLNEPTKVIVRQLTVAKAKELLGLIRGKFSGKVSIPQAEMTMDYQMLVQQGREEYKEAMDSLRKRLERMRPANVMEEQAKLAENQNKIQQYTPLGIKAI